MNVIPKTGGHPLEAKLEISRRLEFWKAMEWKGQATYEVGPKDTPMSPKVGQVCG